MPIKVICREDMNKIIVTMIPVLLLTGCATGRLVETGTVTAMHQVAGKDYKPGRGTAIGAGVGAGSGAAGGAILAAGGCAVGAVLTLGLAAPMCPVLVGSWAAMGAAAGGIVGSTSGYIADVHGRGKGVYEFSVKGDHAHNDLYVTQYLLQPIQPGDRVMVYQNKDGLYLKKAK